MKTTFYIHDDDEAVLGVYRMQKIIDITNGFLHDQIAASGYLAISGAMRWPIGMRPEVLIGYSISEMIR